jgi:hypothetical protein
MWDKELTIVNCANCAYWSETATSILCGGGLGRCEMRLELTTEDFHCIQFEPKDQTNVG